MPLFELSELKTPYYPELQEMAEIQLEGVVWFKYKVEHCKHFDASAPTVH